jgi:hypothetical protein
MLMTDIDHIISREAIDAVSSFTEDKMIFPRYIGILDENGVLTQDLDTLYKYGFSPARYKMRELYASVHGNTFAMRRTVFEELGGYNPRKCQYEMHAPPRMGEDCHFNTEWNHWATPKGKKAVLGPPIYMFPVGRYHVDGSNNPMGIFHGLSYEPVKQPLLG